MWGRFDSTPQAPAGDGSNERMQASTGKQAHSPTTQHGSQEELLAAAVHLAFVDPLQLARLGVEGALLQPAELQGEAGPQLLQPALLLAVEDVAVVPHEDVVPLVMEGDHPAAAETRLLVEEAAEHAADPQPQPGAEVVHHDLGLVVGGLAVALRDRQGWWGREEEAEDMKRRQNWRGRGWS